MRLEADNQSPNPRSTRNLTVENGIRDMLVASKNPESAHKLLMETRDFMRASRIHSVCPSLSPSMSGVLYHGSDTRESWANEQDLLKRYTPLADMTESEKIHASARKVGLETPIKYKRPE